MCPVFCFPHVPKKGLDTVHTTGIDFGPLGCTSLKMLFNFAGSAVVPAGVLESEVRPSAVAAVLLVVQLLLLLVLLSRDQVHHPHDLPCRSLVRLVP